MSTPKQLGQLMPAKRTSSILAYAPMQRANEKATLEWQDEALLRQALKVLEVSTRFIHADLRPQCEDAIAALRERRARKR